MSTTNQLILAVSGQFAHPAHHPHAPAAIRLAVLLLDTCELVNWLSRRWHRASRNTRRETTFQAVSG